MSSKGRDDVRKARLAEALRANLKRRKAKDRAVADRANETGLPAEASKPDKPDKPPQV